MHMIAPPSPSTERKLHCLLYFRCAPCMHIFMSLIHGICIMIFYVSMHWFFLPFLCCLLNRPGPGHAGSHQACLSKHNPLALPVACHKQVSALAQWIVCKVWKVVFQGEVSICHPPSFDSKWIWDRMVDAAQWVWVGGWTNTANPLWHTPWLGTVLLQRWLLWHNVLDTT